VERALAPETRRAEEVAHEKAMSAMAGRRKTTVLAVEVTLVLTLLLAGGTLLASAASPALGAPSCFGKTPTIVGTNKADTLSGTSGPDVIVSLGGDDKILGKAGNDRICGGDGRDAISGREGDDRLAGDAGNDHLYGLDGVDLLYGGSGEDELYGGKHADSLHGQADADLLQGDDGKDLLTGGTGNDLGKGGRKGGLFGGPGADRILGGPGNDALSGGPGADRILGGPGNDALRGEDGPDVMRSGDGTDSCSGGRGNDFCNGGPPGHPINNTPEDPDICDRTVETKRSCRAGLPAKWVGAVTGSRTLSGITDEWTASVTFGSPERDPADGSTTYFATGTLDYTTSGTGPDGCTYSGSGTLTIDREPFDEGGLRFDPSLTSYNGGGVLTDSTDYYPVSYSCPDGTSGTTAGPLLGSEWFKTDLSEQTSPEARTLSGDYSASDPATGLSAEYSWNLTAGG
jgi:Ca2+-binding RTX toxin-like protein